MLRRAAVFWRVVAIRQSSLVEICAPEQATHQKSALVKTKQGRSLGTRPCSFPEGADYLDGDGIALGEALPPPGLPLGIGDATVGLLIVDGGAVDRVPNQFHCVKPKNSTISTRRARTAAAIPAPAPEPVSPVSTTSEPAGLQYRRTL